MDDDDAAPSPRGQKRCRGCGEAGGARRRAPRRATIIAAVEAYDENGEAFLALAALDAEAAGPGEEPGDESPPSSAGLGDPEPEDEAPGHAPPARRLIDFLSVRLSDDDDAGLVADQEERPAVDVTLRLGVGGRPAAANQEGDAAVDTTLRLGGARRPSLPVRAPAAAARRARGDLVLPADALVAPSPDDGGGDDPHEFLDAFEDFEYGDGPANLSGEPSLDRARTSELLAGGGAPDTAHSPEPAPADVVDEQPVAAEQPGPRSPGRPSMSPNRRRAQQTSPLNR